MSFRIENDCAVVAVADLRPPAWRSNDGRAGRNTRCESFIDVRWIARGERDVHSRNRLAAFGRVKPERAIGVGSEGRFVLIAMLQRYLQRCEEPFVKRNCC